ncbi:TPA: TniQ family protein [Elizabethkingia anophelis]|nr:TniQ family protein [Elizabethkingia anophelis]HAT3997859.1 TniQ family protein [Elizabethkingia anophelis]HAT4005460.1 TniQ family protein [Elizabethkingia anophelis]
MYYFQRQSFTLPGYIPPERDELLSSWLFRLSYAHKIKPYSFTKFYFEDSAIWNRDIDKYIPFNVFQRLSSITPLTLSQLHNLQLTSYQDIVFEGLLNTSVTEGMGITNLGIYHRTRNRYGLYVCPGCLNKKAYYKKSWRLLSSVVCMDCRCYLIDRCPDCHNPIVFQRLGIGNKDRYEEKPLYLCWSCNYDLRSDIKEVNAPLIVNYQQYINDTVKHSYNEHTQYSFLYFKVLLLFLKKICTTSSNWSRIKKAFISEFGINLKGERSMSLGIEDRAIIFSYIHVILSEWPNNFIPFIKKYKLRYSDFSKDTTTLPFWFYEVFKKSY